MQARRQAIAIAEAAKADFASLSVLILISFQDEP